MKRRTTFLLAVAAGALLVSDPSQANAPSGQYTIGSGTVTDNKTGLVWQQTPPASGYTFSGAQAYCGGLSLNGSGWRAPTVKELMTIVDVTQGAVAAVDTTAFPGSPANKFWTSTTLGGSASWSWYIDFSLSGYVTYNPPSTSMYVRCVR